ncbi:MAG: tetratricopeptide repeat protein [Pseudomonadota bacterium]
MRITCPSCDSDFVLAPMDAEPSDKCSSCPFCHAVFQIVTNEKGEPTARFAAHVQRKLRVCIECSREFEADEGEVIPICPRCKHRKTSAPPLHKGPWKLSKIGRLLDLESEEMVREWIQQGAILPDDELVSPAGGTFPAKQYKQFSQDFREQLRKSRRFTKGDTHASRSPLPAFRWLLRWALLGGAAFLLGWVGYRVITYKPTEPAYYADVQRFLSGLRSRVEPATGPVEDLLKQAAVQMAKDRPDSYETAVSLLERAVVENGGRSPALLGKLAEAYALASGATDNPMYRVAASGLAALAVQVAPDHVEGYVARIRTALNAHDIASARADVQTGFTVDPQSPRLLLARAQTLLAAPLNALSAEELIQSVRTALAIDPTLVEAYDVSGQAYAAEGRPVEARREFEKRLQAVSGDSKALFRLGELEERAGNFRTAREWYQHALRQGPELAPARLRLALIYNRVEGNPSSAERHLREILGRFRRFAAAREIFISQVELARILLDSDRAPEAMEALQQLPPDFLSSPLAIIARADALVALGRTEEALVTIKDFTATHPGDARIYLKWGVLLGNKERTDEAIRVLRQAIQLNPKDLGPYVRAVQFLVKAKRVSEALEIAGTAVSRNQMLNLNDHYVPPEETAAIPPWKGLSDVLARLVKEQKDQFTAHAFLGLCQLQEGLDLHENGPIVRGLASLAHAKLLNKNQEFVPLYLGRAYLILKNPKKARAEFEQSLHSNPLNPAARAGLGESLAAGRKYADAQAELSRIVSDPDWAGRALDALGNVLMAQKHAAEAGDHWKASLKADPSFIPPWRSLLAMKN